MDTSRLNKIVRILVRMIKLLFIVIIILCLIILIWYGLYSLGKEDRAKRREKENISCYNNTLNIEPYNNGYVSIYFKGEYSKKSLKGLKIEHIREGQRIKNIAYTIWESKGSDTNIDIKDSLHFQTRDSLIFTFSDGEKIVLREFRNQAYHGGGRVFLGCYWSYCLHKNDTIVVKGSDIDIKPAKYNKNE